LLRQLAGRVRVAAVTGPAGLFGVERVTREEVLRAFAPVARGAPAPVAALQTDVLIATDLLSEGLNLQDAARLIHYDLPWSPARLAQRVGRIDRLGSPHPSIETVAFLPPPTLAAALTTERRLARKIATQRAVGAAQIETLDGARIQPGRLDWCDRLQRLADPEPAAGGAVTAACDGGPDGTVLIVAIGDLVETIVIDGAGVRPYPAAATELCERALLAEPRSCDRGVLQSAIERAAPLIRSRLAAIAAARWRGADRDRLSRRLVPWVLTEAKRAARRRDQRTLTRIDRLIGRLVAGMTAGEELSLAELLEARQSLRIDRLLDWHASLPAAVERDSPGGATLIAAVQLRSD